MKTVLIAGGAGFIGSHLAERLLSDHRVVVMDNFITGKYENVEHLIGNDNFRLVKQDVSIPLQDWATLNEEIHYILHLASPASPKHYGQYPIETLKVNSYGTHNLLELAKFHNARILVTSTSEVYGDPLEHPQSETYYGNVNPIGIRACYDEGKRYMEAAVSTYARVYGLDTRIVRLFNTYGPRMCKHDGRAVPEFINNALENKPLVLNGTGLQTRSLCYVSDTVKGIIDVLFSNYSKPVNIGNIQEMTMLELARTIIHLTESNSKIEFVPATENDPNKRRPDIKVAETLGWEPTVGRIWGLEETIKWYKHELV